MNVRPEAFFLVAKLLHSGRNQLEYGMQAVVLIWAVSFECTAVQGHWNRFQRRQVSQKHMITSDDSHSHKICQRWTSGPMECVVQEHMSQSDYHYMDFSVDLNESFQDRLGVGWQCFCQHC